MRPQIRPIVLKSASTVLGLMLMACTSTMMPVRDATSEVGVPFSELPKTENISDRTNWGMLWAADLDVWLPSETLAPDFENFMQSKVKLHTGVIDGELVMIYASAGCNPIRREMRRRVVTPAQTKEIIRDGHVEYQVIPATFVSYIDYVSTQVGCRNSVKVDGRTYEVQWAVAIEAFMSRALRNATLLREGDQLSWIDKDGSVLASFKELPDPANSKHP